VPSGVGDALFQIESGIASWFQNCGQEHPAELFPYRPEVVGQPPAKVVFGKGSGIDSIKNGLKTLGVEFTETKPCRWWSAAKEFSLQHKRLLTVAEFNSILSKVLPAKAGAV
jgi:isopropylmalate/homocitrate/citramalate synthase